MDNQIEESLEIAINALQKCLQYAQEWSKICMSAGVSFADSNVAQRRH